ncbi:MAG: hypothetical protein KBA26_10320 [Candidatus Delongbacteria bacterium]|nr:hypothetical protein [Candidatus Delongbacteria bacterium]
MGTGISPKKIDWRYVIFTIGFILTIIWLFRIDYHCLGCRHNWVTYLNLLNSICLMISMYLSVKAGKK